MIIAKNRGGLSLRLVEVFLTNKQQQPLDDVSYRKLARRRLQQFSTDAPSSSIEIMCKFTMKWYTVYQLISYLTIVIIW